MRKVLFVVLLAVSGFLHADEGAGVDVGKLRSVAVKQIQNRFPTTLNNEFVLVGLDIDSQSKELRSSSIELGLVDKGSLHSDNISKFMYDRYIVSFDLLTGDFLKIVKGGWGSYENVDSSVIK